MNDATTRLSLLVRLVESDASAASAAWREFDAIYRPMLLRVAKARGLGDADADDVVQDCMSKVTRHIQSFEYDRSKGRFKGWLCTLINNRIRNLHRDRREHDGEGEAFALEQNREAAPDEVFEAAWMDEHLRFAISQVKQEITPKAYEAFRRHVLEGGSVEEVCAECGLTAGQLYKVKWSVTQKIKTRLTELLLDGDAEGVAL